MVSGAFFAASAADAEKRFLTPFSLIAAAITIALAFAGTAPVCAQEYPAKPIRLITSDPGSGSDYSARVISKGISGQLGKQIIVDNRPSVIAPEVVAKSPPDGYTLLFYGAGLWLLPLLRSDLRYDLERDFAPVAWATTSPTVLAVHPSLPARSVKALTALAKSRPGVLNYASGAPGTINHLAAEMFKHMAAVNIVRIGYKGMGAALGDLVAGQVHLMFVPAVAASPHVKSGRLAALAVTSARPSPLLPGLPTVADAGGLPGYELVSVNGVFAPARTPATIVNRLSTEINRLYATAEVKEQFAGAGVEAVGGTPEMFAAKIKEQVATMGKVVRDAGIRAE
jgi:tripartite-type tricarboxylate transporter receptor subunit TctC